MDPLLLNTLHMFYYKKRAGYGPFIIYYALYVLSTKRAGYGPFIIEYSS